MDNNKTLINKIKKDTKKNKIITNQISFDLTIELTQVSTGNKIVSQLPLF